VTAHYVAQRGTVGWAVVSTGNGEVVEQYGRGSVGAANAQASADALNREHIDLTPARFKKRDSLSSVETNPALTPAALKIWRRKHHITQGELAALLGVHISTTHRWEQGDVPIPVWLRLALESLERRKELTQP
jgi:DNA-binding transcriptional regulator YiaG